MPLDAVYISRLREELKEQLLGARIDRVRQPERDTVLLSLRGPGGGGTLLLCFGSGSARVCLTEAAYENPPQPPMFCMLLRKHLTGARILDIRQPENERLLLFDLAASTELGETTERTLAAELTGRSANLVLIDNEGRIVDAARRVDADMSPKRQLLPGMIYRLPPRPENGVFTGLSPLLRRELEFRGLPAEPASLEGLALAPTLLTEGGEPKDFTCLPILQYGPSVDSVPWSGWSALLEAWFAARDRQEHLRSRAKSLQKLVRGTLNRTERKLAARLSELRATEDREADRRRGDLITANIWRMRPGDTELVTEDFYAPDAPTVTIPLDPRKSPQQNAAVCYRLYAKKKAAREHLESLIEENNAEREYLASVAEELNRATSRGDLEEIRRELIGAGYLRQQKAGGKKAARTKPLPPLEFTTSGGLTVLVGRNNLQNDQLTFHTARRSDIWLHALRLHGAHVILCCADTEPPEQDLYEAACLAAAHSEGAGGGKVPVDCTQVRNVKKPRGARPGKVIYTNQRTLLADPSAAPKER